MSKASDKPAPVPIWATLKALYHRFRPAILAQGGLIAAALVLVLGAVGFRLAEPWPLKFVFDGLMAPDQATGLDLLDRLDWSVELSLLIGAFVTIVLAHTGLTFLSKMAMALAFKRLLSRVRSAVFDHLLHMSVLSHHGYGKGDLSNRVTVDIDRLRLAGTNNAINLIVNVLTMVGMLLVMLWLNWQLALIALIAVPLFQLLTRRLMPQITGNARAFRASDGVLASETVHATTAIQTIQGMDLFARAQARLDENSAENLRLGMRSTILKTVLRQAVTVLFAAVIGLLLWRGAVLVGAGALTPGDLIIFMAYLREGMEKPMIRFSANLAEIGRGAASGQRLLSLLEAPRAPAPGSVTPQASDRAEIRFENVRFAFPGGPTVLDGVSFTLRPGERVAITGPSGSGKSTLIGLLLRLYEPASGRITLNGIDIAHLSRDALMQAVAPVFQSPDLFNGTVRENLILGRDDIPEAALDLVLAGSASNDFVATLTGGLDHRLQAGGDSLSGGQAQRLSLARAFLRGANVLLLDEPTSALDPASRDQVMATLVAPSHAVSVLMITHDSAGLEQFDRVLRLEDGQLTDVSAPVRLVAGRQANLTGRAG